MVSNIVKIIFWEWYVIGKCVFVRCKEVKWMVDIEMFDIIVFYV